MAADLTEDADAQDLAETYDETNITTDGDDIAHPDMERDVYDVTSAEDDSDEEDEEDDDDFDPDEVDEAELETMLESDDGVDEPRELTADEADRVAADGGTPADYQGGSSSDDGQDDEESADIQPVTHSPRVERHLDEGLEETFPASDPVSISPGAD